MRTLFIGPCLLPTEPHRAFRARLPAADPACGGHRHSAGGWVAGPGGSGLGGATGRRGRLKIDGQRRTLARGRFTATYRARPQPADPRLGQEGHRRGDRRGGGLVYSAPSSRPARGQSRDGGDHHCPREARRPPRETGSHLRPPGPPECPRAVAGDVYPRTPAPPGVLSCPGRALMPATVIVGLQWGDEGKGKTTDFLAEHVAVVVRYQGGDNAGHTVVVGDETVKLQLCPSGVLYPHITSVIGNGVVVNPATLIAELDMLAAKGIDVVEGPRQPQRARDHAVPRGARQGQRGPARRREGGHDGARHRAGVRRPRLAARAADGGPVDREVLRERHRPRAARQEPAPRRRWAPRASRSTRWSSRRPAWGDRLAPHLDDTTWLVQDALAARRPRAARGRPGHAARPRPRQLPVRDLVEPGRGRRVHRRRHRAAPGRRGHRRDEGLLHARGLRAVPHRAVRRRSARASPSAAASSARSPAGRGGSAGSTPCRCATPSRSTRTRAVVLNKLDILSGIETIRLCVAYEIDGKRVEVWPSSGNALSRARRSTRTSRAGSSRSTTSAASPTCPRTPGATCRPSRTTRASRSCSSPSGPSGPRPSSERGGRSGTARRRRPDRVRSPR